FQAHISLHHFVPAMLLPLAAFWRLTPAEATARMRFTLAAAVAALVAIVLAIPSRPTIDLSGRIVGEKIFAEVGNYGRSDAANFRHANLMLQLFPFDWDPGVPSRYGGSPIVWNHYALRNPAAVERANYLILAPEVTPPRGARRVASDDAAVLWVRSDSVWH